MNTDLDNNELVLKNVQVTVSVKNMPENYFFGALDVYRSGDLFFYTNGRLEEETDVQIKFHDKNPLSVKTDKFSGCIQTIQPLTNPDYTYIYEYNIECQDIARLV